MRIEIEDLNESTHVIKVISAGVLNVYSEYTPKYDKTKRMISGIAKLNKVRFDNTSKVVKVRYESSSLHSSSLEHGFKFQHNGPGSEYIIIPSELCNIFKYLPKDMTDSKKMGRMYKIKFPTIELSPYSFQVPDPLKKYDKILINLTMNIQMNFKMVK